MAFTQVTVTATFTDADGGPVRGWLRFTPTEPMRNGAATVPVTPVSVTLDGSGVLSVSLAANTDADTESGSGDPRYLVEELLTGQRPRAYRITIPHSPGTLDLADVTPE